MQASSDQAPVIPSAIVEPSPPVNLLCNQILYIPIVSKDADGKRQNVQFSKQVLSFVEKEVIGAGNVDLVYMKLWYQFTGRSQEIEYAITDSSANVTAGTVPQNAWSFAQTSNKYTPLIKQQVLIDIPAFVTRQLRPVSSLVPQFTLHMSVSSGVRATLEIGLKHGVLIKNIECSFH